MGVTGISGEVIRLFDELRGPLLRYLQSLGVPPRDGEDIVQDAFLALHRHLLDGRPQHNLPGWLFRVARNLGLKRLEAARQLAPGAPDVPSPAAGPEAAILDGHRQRRIQGVIAALPEQDRACLYLRAAGLRYRAIAEATGMSLGAVAHSLGRSMDKLSRALEHEDAPLPR